MNSIELSVNEDELVSIIKDFLSLQNLGTWKCSTKNSTLSIKFIGNCYKVEKKIYDWLNILPRRHNFELFANKSIDSLPKIKEVK